MAILYIIFKIVATLLNCQNNRILSLWKSCTRLMLILGVDKKSLNDTRLIISSFNGWILFYIFLLKFDSWSCVRNLKKMEAMHLIELEEVNKLMFI